MPDSMFDDSGRLTIGVFISLLGTFAPELNALLVDLALVLGRLLSLLVRNFGRRRPYRLPSTRQSDVPSRLSGPFSRNRLPPVLAASSN